MSKFTVIRILCYFLSILTLFAAWYYVTDLVNEGFDLAEATARTLARDVAALAELDPEFVELITLDKMHADRTIVFGVLMLFTLVIVLALFGQPIVGQTVRVFIAIVLAHVLLAVAWIGFTRPTSAWYAVHYDFLKTILRYYGQHKAETLVLRIGQAHGLLIMGEAMMLVGGAWWMLFSGRVQKKRK